MISKTIDEFIMREIGNEGPPASKFYIAEMKDIVARYCAPPPREEDSEDSASSEESQEPE